MLITNANIDAFYVAFKTEFNTAFAAVPDEASRIIMTVKSATRDESYGWLASVPTIREWVGPRIVGNLTTQGFTIRNRKFESTVSVSREDMQDDRVGVLKPMVQLMGTRTMQHKQSLIFELLKAGFTSNGFDNQFFFDTDHPVQVDANQTINVANTDGGSGPAWFLLDTTKPIKPLIFQEREPYEFTTMTQSDNPHVFMNDEFIYGVRARLNVGFGLWQLAWGSKQVLNASNYAAARAAMMGMKADGGSFMGVMPNVLVVPPALEDAARRLLNTEFAGGGDSNPWKGTADLIVTPFVA